MALRLFSNIIAISTVLTCSDAAAWIFRPAVLLLARPAELCVMAVVFLCSTLYVAGEYMALGFYSFFYVVTHVAVHWTFQLHSILSDFCRTSIQNPAFGFYFSLSITLGEFLIALSILAAIFLEIWQTSSGEKMTWEEREEELKKLWEDRFENKRWRLEMERQELEEKRKNMEHEQQELENERKELELDIEEREREYVETRAMNLREWWSEKRALEEKEEEARRARMAEREAEEKKYRDREKIRREQEYIEHKERMNVERTMWEVEENNWRKRDLNVYLESREMERARWERLDLQERMKWCQMRLPWVRTTAEFKKEMQGMDLETPD